jgi:inorganic pyrophosphatase
VEDIPLLKEQVELFFSHYKDIEPGKWVKVEGWGDIEAARREIENGVKQYQNQK